MGNHVGAFNALSHGVFLSDSTAIGRPKPQFFSELIVLDDRFAKVHWLNMLLLTNANVQHFNEDRECH